MTVAGHDPRALEQTLAELPHPVRLVFFLQTFGCDTCVAARRILDQIAALAPQVAIEEYNLVLDKEKAAAFGVDRVPAIVVLGSTDPRIRFYGAPSGYELVTLVEAIRLASTGRAELSAASRTLVDALEQPRHLQVFVTPTCVYCPRVAAVALALATASAHVTTSIIEVTEFPDLAQRYQVTGVPKTIVDDRVEILGALPEDEFVRRVVAAGEERRSDSK